MRTRIHTIATHKGCHLDEYVALWMLKHYGNGHFPGVEGAVFGFWDGIPSGKTFKQLFDQGILCVGMGGGLFDEHLQNGQRKPGVCAATLVAKELGLDEDDALKPLLEFVRQRDSGLGKNKFELPALIKTRQAAGRNDQTIVKWVFDILDDIQSQALNFYEKAGTDFRNAKTNMIPTMSGEAKLVVGRSDSREFAKYARSRLGCKADVVIQMKSDHHVFIQTNDRLNLNLAETVRILRVEELRLQGKAIPEETDLLGRSGKLPDCPEWYFFEEGRSIMNGSLTHSAPATKLELDHIEGFVRIGLDPTSFEPSRATACRQGTCTTKWSKCPWERWKLDRCCRIRSESADPQPCADKKPQMETAASE